MVRTTGGTAVLLAAALALAGCAPQTGPRTEVPAPQPVPGAASGPPAAAPLPPLPLSAVPPPAAPAEPAPADGTPADAPVSEPGLRRVAVLLPLGGRHAALGRDLLDAAQLALFDAGLADLALVPFDTLATPAGARAAAARAVDAGAELILGPLLSSSVAAAAPTARARGVPMIAFSNDRAVAGNGVWPMGFVPQEQVRRIVAFARAQGLESFAMLAPSTAYGDAMVAALQGATVDSGGRLGPVLFYPPGDTGATTAAVRELADYDRRRQALLDQRRQLGDRDDQVSRSVLSRLDRRETLGEVGYEAVLLPAAGDELMQLAPLLPYYDIDPARIRFLGTWQWDVPGIGAEPALAGAWFAAPPPEARPDFEARFRALYGRPPARLATLAYDAMALAGVIARQAGAAQPRRRRAYSVDALTQPDGFLGIDGIFRLLPSGEVERGLAVVEIARDGFRIVDPAPQAFGAPGA